MMIGIFSGVSLVITIGVCYALGLTPGQILAVACMHSVLGYGQAFVVYRVVTRPCDCEEGDQWKP